MTVYLIQNIETRSVKIGHARNPLARLAKLRTGSAHPLQLIRLLEGGAAGERQLHAMFAAHRKRGEWFALSAAQIAGDMPLPDLPLPVPEKKGRPTLGPRPMTGAEREAKRRARVAKETALAAEALAFLLQLAPEEMEGMQPDKRALAITLRQRAERHVTQA
jgi:hypothetical protein